MQRSLFEGYAKTGQQFLSSAFHTYGPGCVFRCAIELVDESPKFDMTRTDLCSIERALAYRGRDIDEFFGDMNAIDQIMFIMSPTPQPRLTPSVWQESFCHPLYHMVSCFHSLQKSSARKIE